MQYYVGQNISRIFTLRLDQGDYLLESVQELVEREDLKNGVVVSGIGTFDNSVLHMVTTCSYPAVEYFDRRIDEPLELAGVQGIIADGKPHLHGIISSKDSAVAGHIEPGCRTLYLCELVIFEFGDLKLKRCPNDKGINKLMEQ